MRKGGSRAGAGRPGRHRRTDTMRSVDVRRLAREQLLYGGSSFRWEWLGRHGNVQASVWMKVEDGAIRFVYRLRGKHDVNERVPLINTACNYGGERKWFACPCCGKRCAILYLGQRVACRTCYRLTYASQSDDAIQAIWRRKRRLAAQIGSNCEEWRWKDKPRGMHQATFQRIRSELNALSRQLDVLVCVEAEIFFARVGLLL